MNTNNNDNSLSNKYSDTTVIKLSDEKSLNKSMMNESDINVESIKQNLIDEVNTKLIELNVPSDIQIKNISEFNSLVKLVKTSQNIDKIDWISQDLIDFIDVKDSELIENINENTSIIDINIQNASNSSFDYVNKNYDLEYEKTKFLLDVNSKLKSLNVPSDISINNISEFNSFNTMVQNFTVNPLNPSTLNSWLNNPALKTFSTLKNTEFNDLVDPLKNNILSGQNVINGNLGMMKDLLNLDSVPSIEQLQNVLNLPEGFNMDSLTSLLKTPNLNLTSFDDLKSELKVPDLTISLPSLTNVQIPNFTSVVIPKLSSLTTGLSSDRMLKTLSSAQMKDFPETTPWADVIKYQTAQITKAVFDELSKMTFYIEPGEIKVLTNGSPSTHQGQNINRIKIKLK